MEKIGVNTLDAVKMYLGFVAGAGRRAEVETMAGWIDVDRWTPYGANHSKYVAFWYDPEAQRIRERAATSLLGPIFLDKSGPYSVFGVWPVRFSERTVDDESERSGSKRA